MKFTLQMLLNFFIFKATKLAYRTGKLNPRTQKEVVIQRSAAHLWVQKYKRNRIHLVLERAKESLSQFQSLTLSR